MNASNKPPRVVLDTNVLVSGLLKSSNCRRIIELLANQAFTVVTSLDLEGEFDDVIERPHIQRRIDGTTAARVIVLIRRQGSRVHPVDPVPDAPDPNDARVLAAVREGQADVLVTGDRRLLELRTYANAVVLTPRDFLDWLAHRTR